MEIAPKALYNSLRMSFLQTPTMQLEPWKVEDYRKLSTEELFGRLNSHEIVLDRSSFVAYADEHDCPEELYDSLMHERGESDQVYLLLFELWRRLVPEKQSISIICDELDHQIFLYDSKAESNEEELVDAIASFYAALEENVDRGLEHDDVYAAASEYLANDIQTFLIDYLSDLIERGEYLYASEILEQFYPFMPDKKWFDLINCRLIASQDIHSGHKALRSIYIQHLDEPDLQFNLDILSYLVNLPDPDLFHTVAKASLPLVEEEDDFQELISITSEFYRNYERLEFAEKLSQLLEKRESKACIAAVSRDDPDRKVLEQIFSSAEKSK
jgi:hypothetical protein